MEKQQLMEYLRAVCSGEEALIASSEMQLMLRRKYNSLEEMPSQPIEPERKEYNPDGHVISIPAKPVRRATKGMGYAWNFIGGIIGFLMYVFVLPHPAEDPNGYYSVIAPLISIILGSIVTRTLIYVLKKFTIEMNFSSEMKEFNDRVALAEEEAKNRRIIWIKEEEIRYSSAMNEYRTKVENYHCLIEKRNAVRAELKTAIEENQNKYDSLRDDLYRLYSYNIIYSDFRNAVAVHQILKYLEMELCDSLTGPTGAYKYYLDELHAQQICGSIQELQNAMEKGMNIIIKNQLTLIREMQRVNENISKTNDALERELSGIRSEINAFRIESQAQANEINHTLHSIDNSLNSTNQSLHSVDTNLDSLRQNLHASVNNEYVVLRETRIRKYLERPVA